MGKMGAVLRTKAAFWHSDILVVADPLALWHIDVKNPNDYVKSNLSRALVRRLMGESLVWAEGTEHKKLRAAFAPCFSFLKVREMESVVLKAADMLVGSMKNYIIAMQSKTSNKSLRSNPPIIMNLSGWTNKATLDVIGRVGFDFDFGLGESPEARELSRIWEEQARESATFAGFVGFLAMRAFPFLASLPIKAMEKQSAYKLYVRSIGSKIAGSKIARIQGEDDSKDDSDIISAFIRYSRKEGSEASVDKLLDHFTTFIQAGNDTTATSVNYALLTLAQHPEVQTHLRNELEDFGREPTFDDLHNKDVLKFLDAVTKESLRMFPVGAHSERVALKDDYCHYRSLSVLLMVVF
ncbi:cytochrome P450 [Cantharellus anzutake]|uniref:cytochrome P450 n=1 Tax=Cantharellus anzutake TaxID=1750568 RepID=UPI00190844D6|nr:cytochrome P450 [Cantharellus anzutake]KAF8325826.1 cytochrome P450 [Cantharellus anzutake]